MPQPVNGFDKYEKNQAYHWNLTDASWTNGKYNPPTVARFSLLEELLADQPSGRVLDIGCGDGYLLHRIGKMGKNVELYGIDYEEKAIKLAKQRLRQCGHLFNLTTGSAYVLPYKETYFDIILMTEVIEHLENPKRALREVQSVLHENGVFFVTTPNKQPDLEWDPEYHVQEFSEQELKELLENNFATVDTMACCPMTWMRFWRTHSICRSIVRSFSRFGFNPMMKSTNQPSQDFGQLIYRCSKR